MKKIIASMLLCILVISNILPIYADDQTDAFSFIEPSSATSLSKVSFTADKALGQSQAKGSAVFKNLMFSQKAVSVELTLSTGEWNGGTPHISLYLDSLDGIKLATVEVINSGWGNPQIQVAEITHEFTGVHDIVFLWEDHVASLHGFKFVPQGINKTGFEEYKKSLPFIDIEGKNCEQAVVTEYELGFLSDFDGNEFLPNLPVKREEYVGILNGILGAESNIDISEVFDDILIDNKYADDIAALYEYRIVAGKTENKFCPNDFISVEEAVIMLLRLLGYNAIYGEINTANYMTAAKEAKLNIPTTTDANLRRGEMARLIFNALDAKYIEFANIGIKTVNSVEYEQNKGILYKTKEIQSDSGIVTMTASTSLYTPKTNISYGNVTINDVVYEVGESAAVSLLGYDCDFYFTEKDGTRTIKFIYPRSDNKLNIVGKGTEYEITEISDKEIKYTGDGNGKTIKISPKANIIYNGKAVEKPLSQIVNSISDFKGYIKYIKNNYAETFIIMEYEDIVVEKYDEYNDRIEDKLTGNYIVFDDEDNYYIEKDEKIMAPSAIAKNAPALLFRSKNEEGEQIKIIKLYNNYKITGKVQASNSDGITIDGNEYTNPYANVISAGMVKTFYINPFNEIVYMEDANNTDDENNLNVIGCLIKCTYDDSNESFCAKIFTHDKLLINFQCSDKIVIDGIAYNDLTKAYEMLKKADTMSVIRYSLDSEKRISMIDTYLRGNGNASDYLSRLNDTTQNFRYMDSEKILILQGKGTYPVSEAAKCFIMWYDENLYDLLNVSEEMNSSTNTKGKAYSVSKDGKADYFVVEDKVEKSGETVCLVNKCGNVTLDRNEESANSILVTENGNLKEYIISTELLNMSTASGKEFRAANGVLQPGDFISIKKNSFDEITKISFVAFNDFASKRVFNDGGNEVQVVPKISNDVPNSSSNREDWQEKYSCGKVVDIVDNFAKVELSDGTTEWWSLTGKMAKYIESDAKNPVIPQISVTDINRGDRITLWMYYSRKFIVVYK